MNCPVLTQRLFFSQVETWVAPDVQWEEMVTQPDGTKLPQFTLIVRGYKLTFRAKVSHTNDRSQYGLFASCTPLKSNSSEEDELNFRVSHQNYHLLIHFQSGHSKEYDKYDIELARRTRRPGGLFAFRRIRLQRTECFHCQELYTFIEEWKMGMRVQHR